MFYKHLHDPSCDLFMHGEEAPQSKEAQLQAALDAERANRLAMEACVDRDVKAIKDLKAQLATLQAQLRQAEHDAETYRKMHTVCTMNLALANNELTTLQQLVAALPVVDVQEVSVWLSPDESGWLVSKRPAFPAGLYWAKFRTQDEADSFRSLLAYRATLVAQDAGVVIRRIVDDSFGSQMEMCSREDCGLQVVRPGQFQCLHPNCYDADQPHPTEERHEQR